jgi:hypothetical protein
MRRKKMEIETEENVAAEGKGVRYTMHLTEALENGDLSPEEYARQRADLVGRANIIQSLLVPMLTSMLNSISHLFKTDEAQQPK